MLVWAILAVVGIGWLWWKGWLGADAGRKIVLAAGTGLTIWLLGRGQTIPGLGVGAATAALFFGSWMRKRVSGLPMHELEARQLLGVGLNASRADILAAHRQRIAQVHPDRNPAEATQAARVNAARDYLIKNLPPTA